MSRFDRFLGLARSMAIYHGIAGRHRRLRRLYAGFVTHGDLVFDIGAHAGNRARAFASLGCRVVALEPQPDFARVLRTVFRGNRDVTVVEAAVSDVAGRATLALSERTPTVTTLADDWREARAKEQGFNGVEWNRRIEVETTTLDRLIVRYGAPRFVKIDCEGSEAAVLAGLTQPVPALSFEFLPWTSEEAEACVARLKKVGPYEFNWSKGESGRLASGRWLSDREVLAALRTPAARGRAGDVYARLAPDDQRRTR
jgi:FkbM family methyltransferase